MATSSRYYQRLARWIPEVLLFGDDAERKAALRASKRAVFREWPTRVLSVVFLALLGVAAGLANRWLWRLGLFGSTGGGVAVGGLVACGIGLAGGAVIGIVIGLITLNRLRWHLRQQLVASGVPVCIHCGYDLRGQTEARCPECGRSFDAALLARGQDP